MVKNRLLALLKILQTYSDDTHPLPLKQIIAHLEEDYQIKVNDRKTIYDDIKALNNLEGVEIIATRKGYCLDAYPFSLAEVKILNDAVNTLKSADRSFKKRINAKLQNNLSLYARQDLNALLDHDGHNGQTPFIYYLEDALKAIIDHHYLNVTIKSKTSKVMPYFVLRANDYYYLLYTYLNNDKLYRLRFDRIKKMEVLNATFIPKISKSELLNNIKESTKVYHKANVSPVTLKVLKDDERIYERLEDDFPNAIINKDRHEIYLKVDINPLFFAALVNYADQIKIASPLKVRRDYIDYLNNILKLYLPEK